MKIADQNIQLSSQHYLAKEAVEERAHEKYINGQLATRELHRTRSLEESGSYQHASLKNSRQPNNIEQRDNNSAQLPGFNAAETDQVEVSEQSKRFTPPVPLAPGLAVADHQQINLPPRLIKMIEAVEAMMERILGEPYKLKVMGYNSEESNKPENESANTTGITKLDQANTQVFNGRVFNFEQNIANTTGERWTFHSRYSEIEQNNFKAKGSVTTEDGRQIDFKVNMMMQRQFHSEVNFEKTEGVVLVDPLVVNFGGQPAQLTVDKIDFDLDADGEKDNISFVTGNSGFVALDKNHDGVINDGSELFGAMTGNGFNELKAYDDDNNGWIDENDAIFSQLQIWHKDENGFDHLTGLMQLDIGAIYLQNTATEFALKDSDNQQHGQITHSGVYLKESGGVGTVQQLDLVV